MSEAILSTPSKATAKPITLDRLSVADQVIALEQIAGHLVDVVNEHEGQYDKDKTLLVAARRANVSISQMPYVLTYARAEGLITTDSSTSTIHASVAASEPSPENGVASPSNERVAAVMDEPLQRQTEVVVGHRIGYWGGDDIETATTEEIEEADACLEAHIQWRIEVATRELRDVVVAAKAKCRRTGEHTGEIFRILDQSVTACPAVSWRSRGCQFEKGHDRPHREVPNGEFDQQEWNDA